MSLVYYRNPRTYGGEYEAAQAYDDLLRASAASSGSWGASIGVSALAGASVFAMQNRAKRKVKRKVTKKKKPTKRKKTTKRR